MKERCDAMKSAHENVMERFAAKQLQIQHDEQAAQAGRMSHSLGVFLGGLETWLSKE